VKGQKLQAASFMYFAQGLSFAGFTRAFGQGADSSVGWARKVTEKEDMCGGHVRVGESWWRCVLGLATVPFSRAEYSWDM
jgi:hypothetical protein